MTSWDVLLRKEGDGKRRYQRFSAEAGIPALSRIFAMLSEDEVRHVDALRALQTSGRVDLSRSATLDGVISLLRRLEMEATAATGFLGDPASYVAAMDFEATSARLCGQLAREATHDWERELFQKMAEEDEIHFTVLEQVREVLEQSATTGKEPGVFDAS